MHRFLTLALLLFNVGLSWHAAANPRQTPAQHIERLVKLGNTPAAIAPLDDLLRSIDYLPPSDLAKKLEAARHRIRRIHPLISARIRLLEAMLWRRAGRLPRADRILDQLGVLRIAQLAGPFPFATPLTEKPPQKPGAEYKPVEPTPGSPILQLSPHLFRKKRSLFVLRTAIISKRGRRATLRFGLPGRMAIWINGYFIAKSKTGLASIVDQQAVTIRLKRGINRIVCALWLDKSPWTVTLRVTRTDGKRLSRTLPVALIRLNGLDWALKGRKRRGKPVSSSTLFEMQGRRKRKPESRDPVELAHRLRLTRFLRLKAEVNPKKGLTQKLRNSRWMLHRDLRLADSDTARARIVQRILSRYPADPIALLQHVELAWKRSQTIVAWTRLQRALKLRPADQSLLLKKLQIARHRQLPIVVPRLLALLQKVAPTSPAVVLATARHLDDQNDKLAALVAYRRLLTLLAHRPVVYYQVFRLSSALGRNKSALQVLRLACLRFPHLPFGWLRRASLLAGMGRFPAAKRVLAALLQKNPRHPRWLEQFGRLYDRWQRPGEALRYYREALKRDPRHGELEAYVARLTRKRHSYETPWVRSLKQVTDFQPLDRALLKRKSVVNLYNLTVVRVDNGGTASRFYQRVQLIRTPERLPDKPYFDLYYNPYNQRVEIIRARVTRRSGEVLEPVSIEDHALQSGFTTIYYDYRKKVISFPKLRRGDRIDLRYRISDREPNFLPRYFGDLHLFAESHPTRVSRYVVLTPKSLPIVARLGNTAGRKPEQKRRSIGSFEVRSWTLRRLAGFSDESMTPGPTERSPWLHLSTVKSWPALERMYWTFIKNQFTSDDRLKKLAQTLTGSISGPGAKEKQIRVLHRFVARKTRYVGLEFGVHGYKPYDAVTVNQRRFGDCKDKATLLIMLLKQVNIEAKTVLVRTRDLGLVADFPASLALFNHAMVYVPSIDRYLDATAEFNAFDELPPPDQATNILVIGDGKGLLRSPSSSAKDNRFDNRVLAELRADGSVTLSGTIRPVGGYAALWRKSLQVTGRRREVLQTWLVKHFPGILLHSVSASGVQDLKPVHVSWKGRLSHYGTRQPGGWRIPIPFGSTGYQKEYANKKQRRSPLVFDYPFVLSQRVVIVVPAGYRLVSVPATLTRRGPEWSLTISARLNGRRLHLLRKLTITKRQIPLAGYPALRRLLGEVDRRSAIDLELKREAPR